MEAIVLLSGGIDSTTVLHRVARDAKVTALIFDYGQTLEREVNIAAANANRVNADVIVANAPLEWIGKDCTLLNRSLEIEGGRTREEIAQGGTPSSYVPFRNGIFLAYAVALGESRGIEDIYFGGNGLDSGNYWDDTPQFASAMGMAANTGTAPGYKPQILAPYSKVTKREIVAHGREMGIDYEAHTWSCYRSGDTHCGTCDSCVQRQEALRD